MKLAPGAPANPAFNNASALRGVPGRAMPQPMMQPSHMMQAPMMPQPAQPMQPQQMMQPQQQMQPPQQPQMDPRRMAMASMLGRRY